MLFPGRNQYETIYGLHDVNKLLFPWAIEGYGKPGANGSTITATTPDTNSDDFKASLESEQKRLVSIQRSFLKS